MTTHKWNECGLDIEAEIQGLEERSKEDLKAEVTGLRAELDELKVLYDREVLSIVYKVSCM